MELADPFYARGEQFGIDLGAAKVVFTTRRGGYSRGPYASLNLGRRTDDDPAAVERNRTALEAGLGVRLGFVRQVHGARICELSAATAARHAAGPDQLPQADGLVSSEPGRAAAVLTADCLPVAIAGERAVVMVHAGWRGLWDGVIAGGVEALRAAGSDGRLTAAIGPGAGPCCYEVSDELHERFADQPQHVHRGRNLDLKAIARHQLEQAGVGEIHDIGICTICSDPGLLFSHRRDWGVTGRQAGIAWLN
jgi:polyphenol oxidase